MSRGVGNNEFLDFSLLIRQLSTVDDEVPRESQFDYYCKKILKYHLRKTLLEICFMNCFAYKLSLQANIGGKVFKALPVTFKFLTGSKPSPRSNASLFLRTSLNCGMFSDGRFLSLNSLTIHLVSSQGR